MSFLDQIDTIKLPQHIAIIMDGNGRWAKQKGKLRVFGHQNGVKAVREALEGCVKANIKFLTLYAFSAENWNRPKLEVMALMELLVTSLKKEIKTFQENGVRLNVIGDITKLPSNAQRKLQETIEATKENTHCTLTLALSYSSRQEIVDAARNLAQQVKDGKLHADEINDELFAANLYTQNLPDPDLLIRTSGELRISNFLLWQIAYSELCFLDKMWPEFTKEDLFKSIVDYQQRERRFGKTSEQL
ncbi:MULTISPECIES: isoprenyl transferase [Sphingobacterium]|uniref:Isoprenyl transferase n=4 Tax=Sphingobacterium TaxID=28453 RepID=A0ACD5C951_9SPHI|nr:MULTISPECIES: isoprenyl transferase [Sphingobacterium]QQT33621.1 isoprenyl transferase [Sphingobacterium multivorum]QQT56416.1 isoprenyl transferase [Sphingobacterium multivorum]QRY60783.1 isoprenyl transferase [Sphingobacterium siyangense]RKF35257.1 di-trans,poly-cis-decaprenylcistransferase [Sphingobacterium siyangense]